MTNLAPILLTAIRGGLLLVPVVPLLCAGGRGLPDTIFSEMYFPDVTLKSFSFRILIEPLFGMWLVLAAAVPRYRLRWSAGVVTLSVFVGVVAIADVLGVYPSRSLWSNFERMEGLIGLVHLWAFYVVATSVFDDDAWWTRFFRVSLVVAGVVAVFGLCQILGWFGLPTPGSTGQLHARRTLGFRADARLGSPVYLAIYMLFHIFLALLFVVRGIDRRFRWAYLIGIALAVLVLLATGTRSAQAALVIGAVVSLFGVARSAASARVRRLVWGGIGALGAGVVVVAVMVWLDLPVLLESPLLNRLRWVGLSGNLRLLVWLEAIYGVAERPFLGWGQENFGFAFDKHYFPPLWEDTPWYDHPHNTYLSWLVSAGVPGFVAYMALLGTPFYYLWQRRALQSMQRVVVFSMLVGYAVFNFFMADNLTSYVLFLSVLGMLDVRVRAPRKAVGAALPPWRTAVVALVVAGAIGFTEYHVNVRNLRAAVTIASAMRVPVGHRRDASGTPRTVVVLGDALAEATFGGDEIIQEMVNLAVTIRPRDEYTAAVKRDVFNIVEGHVVASMARATVPVRSLVAAGDLYNAWRMPRQALLYLQRARELAPRKQLILLKMAQSYVFLDQRDKVRELVKAAYDLDPSYRDAAIDLACVALEDGDHQLAEQLVRELHPADGIPKYVPLRRLVKALVAAKRADLLVSIYTGLVDELDVAAVVHRIGMRGVVDRYLSLALAEATAGDFSRARELVGHTIRINPHPAFVARARALLEPLRKGEIPRNLRFLADTSN